MTQKKESSPQQKKRDLERAEALRQNLLKRKQQSRNRQEEK